MGSVLYQLWIVQADLCTSGRLSAILGLCTCLWIQVGRVWRKFWRLSSTYVSSREREWRTKFFWWVMTPVTLSPMPLVVAKLLIIFNGKNLLTISATLKSMDGIWRTLGRSDIWLYITNLTQRKNRPSGFFSTLLRQFVNSSKKSFLKLLALDPLIEDFYISCSCGARRKIGETMSITLKMSSKPWYVHFHGPLCYGPPTPFLRMI